MNLRQLKVFQQVSKFGSITKASEELYMSQPAVSATIKDLEDYLGYKLFDRMSGRIFLNESGKIFLSKTNELLKLYENLEAYSKTIEEEAPIVIGSSITIAMSIIPDIIKEFNFENPKTPVNVLVKNAEDIETLVQSNVIDFGLVEGVVRSDLFEVFTFGTYNLGVYSCINHDLVKRESVQVEDLFEENFLLREKGSAIRDSFDSELLLKGYHVDPIWTSINSQVLLNATSKGLGLTVLPKSITQESINQGLVKELNVRDLLLKNENHLIINKDKNHSKKVKELIDKIVNVKA